MATRRATRKYKDLASFFADRTEHLSGGFCFLPPGSVRGELANEVKLDLSVPVVGRIGPITAQVVQRAPDGGYGLQLPNFDAEAGRALQKLDGTIRKVQDYLEASGALVEAPAARTAPAAPDELEALRARVAELEAEVAALRSSAVAASDSAPTDPTTAAPADDGDAPDAPVASTPDADPTAPEPAEAPSQAEGESPDPSPGPSTPAAAEPEQAAPRGIPIVDVSKVAPTLEGVTEAGGLRHGIMTIASRGLTGLLTVHQEDGTIRYGYFSAGGPVAWRSVPLQEGEVLGMLLLQAGQITKDQLRQSLEIMQTRGVRQGEAFIEIGLMSFSQLIMVLGKQAEFIFQKVLSSASGSWSFHAMSKLPEAFLPPPVRVAALMFRSLVNTAKNMRGQSLAEYLKPHVNSYLQLNAERKKLLADMGLTAPERRLVAIMSERTLRMRELFSMSPVSRQNTAAIFYAFAQLDLFEFGERETRERYLQRMGASIAKKKRQLIQSTHFDVLEVHWISLPDEIEAAYKRLKEEYSLEAYDDLPEDLAKVVLRISARLDEAFAVLNDEFQRREYRKTLVEDFMIVQSAELLAKKGEMAIMRNDRRMAVSCFGKALELQPRSAEYRSSLQRARATGG